MHITLHGCDMNAILLVQCIYAIMLVLVTVGACMREAMAPWLAKHPWCCTSPYMMSDKSHRACCMAHVYIAEHILMLLVYARLLQFANECKMSYNMTANASSVCTTSW